MANSYNGVLLGEEKKLAINTFNNVGGPRNTYAKEIRLKRIHSVLFHFCKRLAWAN